LHDAQGVVGSSPARPTNFHQDPKVPVEGQQSSGSRERPSRRTPLIPKCHQLGVERYDCGLITDEVTYLVE
jgi:hypothetical protein